MSANSLSISDDLDQMTVVEIPCDPLLAEILVTNYGARILGETATGRKKRWLLEISLWAIRDMGGRVETHVSLSTRFHIFWDEKTVSVRARFRRFRRRYLIPQRGPEAHTDLANRDVQLRPPLLGLLLIEIFADRKCRDQILLCIEEDFQKRCRDYDEKTAAWLFWKEIFDLVWPALKRWIRWLVLPTGGFLAKTIYDLFHKFVG